MSNINSTCSSAQENKESNSKVIVNDEQATNKRPHNAGRRWDLDQELHLLGSLKTDCMSRAEIARTMGRTTHAIDYRLCLLAEAALVGINFFTFPEKYFNEGTVICNTYFTSIEEVTKYREYQNVRRQSHKAKMLVKHNIDGLLREFEGDLYIKVSNIPNTTSIRTQMEITQLNAKIFELQGTVELLQKQLASNNTNNLNFLLRMSTEVGEFCRHF